MVDFLILPDIPEQIGHLLSKKTSIEWKIENFLDLTGGYAKSSTFQLSDARFYIQMRIVPEYGMTILQDNNRKVFINLRKEHSSSDIRVEYTISFKKSVEGPVFASLYFNHLFPAAGEGFIKSQSLKAENLSEWNGTIIVVCEARMADNSTAEAETRISVPKALETLSRDYENIYVNGCDTDVTIEVKGKKFSAHSLILSARSSVFRSMFELDMKEKDTGSVNITDCDPESFGAFLQFLYSGKLDVVTSDNAMDLYVTAEKYDVQELKEACSERMIRDLCVESVCDVVRFADLHEDQELRSSATICFIGNVSEILKTAKWQTFARENFTLANELFAKLAEEFTNHRKINK